MAYWEERAAKAQANLLKKSTAATQKQLEKYYVRSTKKILGQFVETYNKVISGLDEGIKPTPADLYKLDSYWQIQGQLKVELEKLGNSEIRAFQNMFIDHYQDVYDMLAKHDGLTFATLDTKVANQLINEIWCADGKSWKQRIWGNINQLQETLNEGLLDCVIRGRSSAELTTTLQERFGVERHRASTIAKTELAHIQTQAAKQRYLDYGIEKYKILGNEEDNCGNHGVDCAEMDRKTFYFNEMVVGKNAPPFHPNCRCCIVPVVEDKPKEKIEDRPQEAKATNTYGKPIEYSERISTREEWKEPIEIIEKLSKEYDTRLVSVKTGSVNSAGSVDMGGNMYLSSREKHVVIHEFAHSISTEALTKYGIVDHSDFWKEVRKIRTKYRKDVGDDSSRWISGYEHSHKDVAEFYAEAFTQAKMAEMGYKLPDKYGNDLTYSNEILKLTDKYFKKKKKKK